MGFPNLRGWSIFLGWYWPFLAPQRLLLDSSPLSRLCSSCFQCFHLCFQGSFSPPPWTMEMEMVNFRVQIPQESAKGAIHLYSLKTGEGRNTWNNWNLSHLRNPRQSSAGWQRTCWSKGTVDVDCLRIGMIDDKILVSLDIGLITKYYEIMRLDIAKLSIQYRFKLSSTIFPYCLSVRPSWWHLNSSPVKYALDHINHIFPASLGDSLLFFPRCVFFTKRWKRPENVNFFTEWWKG